MKRSLDIVGQNEADGQSGVRPPEALAVGDTTIVVSDLGSGAQAHRFAQQMIAAGAAPAPARESDVVLRIVIRADRNVTAHAESDLERDAHFVLGSARPAFAVHLVEALRTRSDS